MAAEADSYCAVEDVQARAQLGVYDGSSQPTLDEVLEFQKERASELYAIVREVMGAAAVGPANYTTAITPANSDAEFALDGVLTSYNAVGAAFDALQAAGVGDSPARSERLNELWAVWEMRGDAVRSAALMLQGYTSRSATHISEGEVTKATVTAAEEDGITFSHSGTEW